MSEKFSQPETVFDEYARYYDLLYRDKDYAAEADYVAGMIRRFSPQSESILELGSGTGIHAKLLSEKAFTVHGVERSPEMLARSQALSQKVNKGSERLTFCRGDIRDARLNKRFDAVIALFHVISYQTTNGDVIAAFKTAREHLNTDGIFVFDIWYGPAVLTQQPAVRIKRMADESTEVTRLAEPVLNANENLVNVNYHVFVRDLATSVVQELKEKHTMRYFFKPEIESFAFQSGFQIIHIEEWLSGTPIGPNTWGACFALRSV